MSEEMTKKPGFVGDATADASLGDVNGSVEVPKNGSFWRKLWAFSGPGALVAVGYMDPGNWVSLVRRLCRTTCTCTHQFHKHVRLTVRTRLN